MFTKISRVNDVHYTILEKNPPAYVICAAGIVPTSGWSDGQLIPYVYITPPADGLQDFDFAAVPPTGDVLQLESPISAHWIGSLPNWAKGVRIHAASNSKELVFATAPTCPAYDLTIAGGEIPWPLARLA